MRALAIFIEAAAAGGALYLAALAGRRLGLWLKTTGLVLYLTLAITGHYLAWTEPLDMGFVLVVLGAVLLATGVWLEVLRCLREQDEHQQVAHGSSSR